MSKIENHNQQKEQKEQDVKRMKEKYRQVDQEVIDDLRRFCEQNMDYLLNHSIYLTSQESKAKCVDNAGGIKTVAEYIERMLQDDTG